MSYEFNELKKQMQIQGQITLFLAELLAKLVAETTDRARVIELLEAEKVGVNAITAGLIDRLLVSAAAPGPSQPG